MITSRRKTSNDNNFQNKLPNFWNSGDVLNWMDTIGMSEYKKIFEKKKDLNGDMLLSINNKNNLKNLFGVKKSKDQDKLFNEIQILREKMIERKMSRSEDTDSSSEGLRDIIESLSDGFQLANNYKSKKINEDYIKVSFILDDEICKFSLKRKYILDQVRGRIKKKYGEMLDIYHNKILVESTTQWKDICENQRKITINLKRKNQLEEKDGGEEMAKDDISQKYDYSKMINSINRPILVLDNKGKIVFINSFGNSIFGYNEGELKEKSINTILHDPYKNLLDDCISSFIKTGNKLSFDKCNFFTCISKNGSVIPFNCEITIMFSSKERYFIATLSKNEKREEEKSIMEQTRDFIDYIQVPTVLLDEDGFIQGINPSFSEFLGYDLHDLLSEDMNLFILDKNSVDKNNYLNNFKQEEDKRVEVKRRNVLLKMRDGKLKSSTISISERKDSKSKMYIAVFY